MLNLKYCPELGEVNPWTYLRIHPLHVSRLLRRVYPREEATTLRRLPAARNAIVSGDSRISPRMYRVLAPGRQASTPAARTLAEGTTIVRFGGEKVVIRMQATREQLLAEINKK